MKSVGERLEAEFGTMWSLDADSRMLDVVLDGRHFVLDYDNGPDWQPRGLFRVAHITEDYAFNDSGDPAFATLEAAEQFLREWLGCVARKEPMPPAHALLPDLQVAVDVQKPAITAMRKSIETAVRIFRSNPDSSNAEIFNRFLESGIERPVAAQLIVLLPLAYGRVVLSESGAVFSETYICMGDKGRAGHEGELSGLPLWIQAMRFAKQDEEPPIAIAGRSSEVAAANAALLDGKKLENMVWGAPVCLWPDFDLFTAQVEKRPAWWRQVWNSPAPYSVRRGELTLARGAMVVAILIGALAIGVVAYYAIAVWRELN